MSVESHMVIEKEMGLLGPERKRKRGFHVFGMLLGNRGEEGWS